MGAKTATVAKLRGRFCSFFFLGGQNRNLLKVRGRKLLLSLLLLVRLFLVIVKQIKIVLNFEELMLGVVKAIVYRSKTS